MNEKAKESYEVPGQGSEPGASAAVKLDFVLDIPLQVTVELGRTEMVVSELLKLAQGSIVELTKSAGQTLDILANRQLIAKGEVVVVKDKYAIRITEIVSPTERVEKLK
ncbi:MAG: flagellar motor switch protein FliN [Deltaproteobacteria bacterium]|jgi:flagellar motor switch protein FliN|nr:flagellar motor switch protein FliN [Deltaproteobacteria bacterium]